MSAKKTSSTSGRLLTEVELQLMNIVWNLDKATIKEVVSHLPKERPLAYTTVATVIKILEQKGFLECQKNSYAHVFHPVVTKYEYENACLDHIVANVFDGEPMALVQRLLMAKKLPSDDIEAIEKALKQFIPRKNSEEVQ